MSLSTFACFYCKHFSHLDPDTDYCSLHQREIFFDAICFGFERYTSVTPEIPEQK